MTVNKIIQVTDYNGIRAKAAQLMSTGVGTQGYGQPMYSVPVVEGKKISPNEWADLAKDIINIYRHQNGTAPSLSSVVVNAVIKSDVDATAFIGSTASGGNASNTLSVTSVTSGMLAVGQTISGPGVPANTVIVSAAPAPAPSDPWGTSQWILSTASTIPPGTSLTAQNSAEFPYLQFDRFFDGSRADDLVVNRFKVDPSRRIAENATSDSITFASGQTFVAWNTTLAINVTYSFSSADNARYFFNSGGTISIGATRSGGAATSQNQSWENLLAAAGDRSFGAIVPQTALSPMNGRNFYTLTNNFQEWYSTTASSPYGSNTFKIFARSPNVADNSTGASSSVQFRLLWTDAYVDPGPEPSPPPSDLVNGTFSIFPKIVKAFGALQPAELGDFTIASPSVSFGSWEPGFTP